MEEFLVQESTEKDIFLETMRELVKLSPPYVGFFRYDPNENDTFEEYQADVRQLEFDKSGLKICDKNIEYRYYFGSRKEKELEKVGLKGRVLQRRDGVFIIETGYWIEKIRR